MKPLPVTLGLALFRLWRRMPASQRKLVVQAARRHGPKIAAGAAAAATSRVKRRVR